MSAAFLSDARSTIRRAIASAPSSVVFGPGLALVTRGVRRRGSPRTSSGFWSVIGSIQSMFADIALDGRRDEVADRATDGQPRPNVGGRVAQDRGVDEQESIDAARKARLEPLERKVGV